MGRLNDGEGVSLTPKLISGATFDADEFYSGSVREI